jgi:hypothetical protein
MELEKPLLPESDGSKVREKNSKEIRDACEEEEEKYCIQTLPVDYMVPNVVVMQ